MSQASRGLAVAAGFVLAVMGLWLAGRAVDSWLDIEPWGQLVGAIAGWVFGFVYVFYALQGEDK